MQYDLHVFDWKSVMEKYGSGEKFIEATFSDEGIGEEFWSFCHDRDADWGDSSIMHFEISELLDEFAQDLPDTFKGHLDGGIRKLITNDEQTDEFEVGEPSEIICLSMGSEEVAKIKKSH